MNIKNLMLGNITLQDLLNYYNATIIYESWLYKDVRGFVDYYRGYYIIYINNNMSYYKKKKTILHELAHIELNQLCQVNNDLLAFYIDKYEDEASKYLKQIIDEIKENEYEKNYSYNSTSICISN